MSVRIRLDNRQYLGTGSLLSDDCEIVLESGEVDPG